MGILYPYIAQTRESDMHLLTLRHRFSSKAEARNAANSALTRSKRGSSTMNIQLTSFFGDLSAEGKLDFLNIKPELRGIWGITSLTHRLSKTLTTSVRVERDNEKENA